MEHPQSERRTLYIITDRGRQALANMPQYMKTYAHADVRFGSKVDMTL